MHCSGRYVLHTLHLADVVCDLVVHRRPIHDILCPTNATLYALVRTVNRGDNIFSHTCRNYYSVVFEDQTILHGQFVTHVTVTRTSRAVSDFCESHPPRVTCMSFCRSHSRWHLVAPAVAWETQSPSVMLISSNETA